MSITCQNRVVFIYNGNCPVPSAIQDGPIYIIGGFLLREYYMKKLSTALLLSTAAAFAAESQVYTGNFFDEDGAYFGPDCDKDGTQSTGAYYTGDYTSPFKKYLGKTDEEIQKKLDDLWNHYFKGDGNSTVYYETNEGDAYVKDIGNNDARSEGMSYGMMIAVQTNHKEEFDKLWKWTKAHMWHDPATGGDGYFSWSVETYGSVKDRGNAPDGEMYFMMSLLFAANRWNDEGYMKDAQAILKACWKGNGNSLFNEQSYIVTFQPSQGNNSWSDPSYSLPAFVDLFTRWSETNNDKWGKATEATRTHLYVSSNKQSGLFSDYNNFDGTPHAVEFNGNATKYMYDAMRCAMNFGMDYYLFGVDADRETEMAKRIIDFFERDGYQHGRFNWDGSNPSESYTTGEKGANAVATYALMNDASYEKAIKKNLEMAWNERFMTGQYRYYDGLVHYLAMLHLSGSFKIWKPKPEVSEKEVTANEYNGVNIVNDTTFYSFESCKLYKVSAKPEPKQGINTAISLNNSVRVRSTNNAVVIDNAPAGTKYTVTDMNGRILSASRTNSASEEIRLTNKGAMLVIVGNKTYRVSK